MPNQTSSITDEVAPTKTKKRRWGSRKKPQRVILRSSIAIIPNPTSKAIDARLNSICRDFQVSMKGHRDHLYELMGNVAAIKLLLDKRHKVRTDFIRSLRRKNGNGGSPRPGQKLNLFTELMARATGARSRAARQLAVKRGRVIEILLGNSIAPEEIAAKIKKEGGIERIYSEANKLASEPAGEVNTSTAEPKSNDHDTTFSARIRASEREALIEKTNLGGRVKLEMLRVGRGHSDFKIIKVRILPSENAEKTNNEEHAWT
jgi:hypothetical protein